MDFDEDFNFEKQDKEFYHELKFDIGSYDTVPCINITYGVPDYQFDDDFFIENKRPNTKKNKTLRINKSKNDNSFDDDFIKYILDDKYKSDNEDSDNENDLCNNPLCDHKDYKNGEKKIDHSTTSPVQVTNIMDLIKLGKTFHCKKNREYFGINLRILNNLVPSLTELSELVGMKGVKTNIINQIIFFLQGFNKSEKCNKCIDCTYKLPCAKNLSNDMLHTVITGPPGVGKTELGRILGKVYKAMGVLSKGHFNIVSRSDLIGKYLGHTAAKTQQAINKCKGGVMFIDEAYSLGNSEGRDSFSKECIDTLNQNLTERRDFLCIIAGYKDQLEKCFFKYNAGLKRRFTFRYDITEYSGIELRDIFHLKVQNASWDMEYVVTDKDSPETVMKKHTMEQKIVTFFNNNMKYFPHFGGDIETLFLECKIYHSRRVMFLPENNKKVLTYEDITHGFNAFIANRQYVEDAEYKKKKLNAAMIY
jgi:hypothetical protein